MRVMITAIALTWVTTGAAAEITGRVVGITDGDTLTVLLPSRQRVKVILDRIDAPEKHQAFGARSIQSLSAMAFQ